MKTLPDNPDLGHLRQQAKDLLAGLRDGDPATPLADAQALLARQYGFRDWPALCAEVTAGHGRAERADPALARAVAHRYGLGTVTGAMRSVAPADAVGRRWYVETDRGRWAVRTVDSWRPIVDADTDVALQRAAADAGVALPAPVRSRGGAVVERVGGHDWRVYRWRHSGPPLMAPVSAATTYVLGGVLARIHRLNLPVDRISPWHDRRLFSAQWPELVRAARAAGAGWADALERAVPTLVELATVGAAPAGAAPVLCHNTLGPAVVRRGPDRDLIVLDWEHAGGQPPAWELADALTHWTVDPHGRVNDAGARALVEGYRAVAGRVPALDPAAFSGAATSLLNHVSEQVEWATAADRGRGPVTGRGDRERRVAHLLTRLPSRRTFEQLLEAVDPVVRG